jgi:hypothetical protein
MPKSLPGRRRQVHVRAVSRASNGPRIEPLDNQATWLGWRRSNPVPVRRLTFTPTLRVWETFL